jgi:hypothetical protein
MKLLLLLAAGAFAVVSAAASADDMRLRKQSAAAEAVKPAEPPMRTVLSDAQLDEITAGALGLKLIIISNPGNANIAGTQPNQPCVNCFGSSSETGGLVLIVNPGRVVVHQFGPFFQ